MHKNRACLVGFAFLMTSANIGPVNRLVETPAAPHENPCDFRT
jgi:hypothetical protein